MLKSPEQPGGESKENLQQLTNEVEHISAQIKELEDKKLSVEQQIEGLSKNRTEKMEKIVSGNEVGDNIIVVLSLPNGGLDPEDLKQIGLEIHEGKSIPSAKIRKHLEDSGWVDLGARPYDEDDNDELEGQVWVKK